MDYKSEARLCDKKCVADMTVSSDRMSRQWHCAILTKVQSDLRCGYEKNHSVGIWAFNNTSLQFKTSLSIPNYWPYSKMIIKYSFKKHLFETLDINIMCTFHYIITRH